MLPPGSHQETLEFSAAEPALPPTEALLLSSGPQNLSTASSQPTPAHRWAQQARQTPWTRAQRAETVYPTQQSRSAGRSNGAAPAPTTGGRVHPQDPWCLLLQALLSRWRFKVCALPHTL